MFSVAAFALASALAASAADISIAVGANNALVFDPTSVTAQVGDVLHFEFQSKNHSVTQSSFANPCTRLPNGIDSGFMFVDPAATAHPIWSFQVNDTSAPLWFYCAQQTPVPHCSQGGMVFAVNPTADKSFDAFQANAKSNSTAAPSGGSASGSVSGVIPPPSSLPTAGGGAGGASGASATAPAATGGGLTSVARGASSTGSGAGAAATSANPNGAVGLSSAGAVSFVALFAAVAGIML
ncbi:hypothetical protein AN958_06502 [Leucoagaricus sp. SymC.cos]|nr:hypothetical protein AN958_06502 [Leucoagaricus sp. SymC.cos]